MPGNCPLPHPCNLEPLVHCRFHLRRCHLYNFLRSPSRASSGIRTSYHPVLQLHRNCMPLHQCILRTTQIHTWSRPGSLPQNRSYTPLRVCIPLSSNFHRLQSHSSRTQGSSGLCNRTLQTHHTYRHRPYRSSNCRHNRNLRQDSRKSHCLGYCLPRNYKLHHPCIPHKM